MSTLNDEILALFADQFGLNDLGVHTPIFSVKTLDSMDVLRLIMELEQTFSVKIPVFEVSIEMFDSVAAISNLIEKRRS